LIPEAMMRTHGSNGVDIGLLLLRLALGGMLISHGLHKWLDFGIAATVQFFRAHGFQGWMVYPVLLAEIGGGVMLMLGVYSRSIALLLLPTLIGAATVHMGNGYYFTAKGGGWEFPAFLIITDLVLALTGAGAYVLRLPYSGTTGTRR
jgi:putative oxidoreductase